MKIEARSFIVGLGFEPDSVTKQIRTDYPGALVQSVRADTATNGFFLEMIAAQTLHAVATQNLLAKKPEIDLLLRLAGTAQISEAIGRSGTEMGKPFLLVVAASEGSIDSLDRDHFQGKELPKKKLSQSERVRVEEAALLNVLKA